MTLSFYYTLFGIHHVYPTYLREPTKVFPVQRKNLQSTSKTNTKNKQNYSVTWLVLCWCVEYLPSTTSITNHRLWIGAFIRQRSQLLQRIKKNDLCTFWLNTELLYTWVRYRRTGMAWTLAICDYKSLAIPPRVLFLYYKTQVCGFRLCLHKNQSYYD